MSYLVTLAYQMMTMPISELEVSYNAAMERASGDDQPQHYRAIADIIEKAANRRFYKVVEQDGTHCFVPHLHPTDNEEDTPS